MVESAKTKKEIIWASWARNGSFGVFFEKIGHGSLGVKFWILPFWKMDFSNYVNNSIIFLNNYMDFKDWQKKNPLWKRFIASETGAYSLGKFHSFKFGNHDFGFKFCISAN
jgi:hypothetical protein